MANSADGEKKRKTESVLGMSLGRSLNLTGSLKKEGTRDLALAGSQSLDLTSRIASKYAGQVRQAEQRRKDRLVPLDREIPISPHERDLTKSLKGELDVVLKKVGAEPGIKHLPQGWDTLKTNEDFQKTMQFLDDHSRTGEFVEQYGAEGKYEGEFLHGMRYGRGRHEFRGEVYDGEWKWDQRHGEGTMTLKDGSKIAGGWQSGKPHGFVTMTDRKDKVVYEGEFRDGKRHGLGRHLFQSGDMYDGGWKEGRLHDRGVYHFINGDKLYGMWSDGQYDGVGVFHYADGSISRRVYSKGVLTSVQDYEHVSQRFGRDLKREGMQKHTADKEFPSDIFLLSNC